MPRERFPWAKPLNSRRGIECCSVSWWGSGGSPGTTATRNWRKTSPMFAASNTSPISNLAIIGRLDLLRTQFREIWIPAAVEAELGQLAHPSARRDIQQAIE